MKKAVALILVCLVILAGCYPSGADAEHTHEYTKTVFAPSCTQKGYTNFSCTCGVSYQGEDTDALGHDYGATVIAPTYTSEGYTLHVCGRCGDGYRDTIVQMPSDVVSAEAIKDYLLPLQDYSAARKENPEFVMIHFISGVVINRNDPYNMDTIRDILADYKVSSHYIIERDGTVRCHVPENLVAYHAGKGNWEDDPKYKDSLNDYAIGIELLAIGSQKDMEPFMSNAAYQQLPSSVIGYTDAQYEALKTLVSDICERNGIPMDRQHVIGHEEYSSNKTDPGELFDWDRLLLETE